MTSTLSYFDHSHDVDAARMRELLGNLSCPLCSGTRETSLLVVIDAPPSGATVRAQCVRCHLFWSFTLDSEIGPAVPAAAPKLPDGPITADEIIELHALLDQHRGSLEQLLWRQAS